MAKILDADYPDHLLYDIENQIWYEPLADDHLRLGFTPWATALMGEVLVFTPKRIGRSFAPGKSFALVEGGKWVGSARAAFAGKVVAHNEELVDHPERLASDAFGRGWMLVVVPEEPGWRDALVPGHALAPAFERWLATGAYRDRTD